MNKKISVLIPEGKEFNLLTFVVNCLSQNSDIDIYVILYSKYAEFSKSNKVKIFFSYSLFKNENEWIDNINITLSKIQVDVLLPIDEFGIENLIRLKHLLIDSSKLVPLVTLNNFKTANNKGLLSQHLKYHEISAPKTFLYAKDEICHEPPTNFPLIIKPLEGFGGGRGIKLIKNTEDFNEFFRTTKIHYPYLIQNYIEGYDIDCSVLCGNGEILAFTIQKGIVGGENEFVPKVGLQFLYEKDLYSVVKKLMKTLHWSGVAHIDMRYDKNDKTFKVIEINPRFWESLEASEIAGVNFPYLYCKFHLKENFEIPDYKYEKFLNLLGITKTIKKNKWFIFKLNFLCKNTPIKYYIKDPLPLIYTVFFKVKSIFKF